MSFADHRDESGKRRLYVTPSDSYIDFIESSIKKSAAGAVIFGGIYHLASANSCSTTRMLNSLTRTPRFAAIVAGYGFVSSSVHCSLVALRGKGDNFNAVVDSSLFFGLLARHICPNYVALAAGALGGAATLALDKSSHFRSLFD